MNVKQKLILISLTVSVLITGLKFAAYLLTHSNAILTDALESIINVLAAGFAFFSLQMAAQPRDFDHPYGHGKIEFFSAGFEGALIILAGIFIIQKAVLSFFYPEPITDISTGIILIGITVFVNGMLGWQLKKQGKKFRSAVLQADGEHLLIDVISSVFVVIGIFVILLTDLYWIDSVLSLVLSGIILWNGFKLVRKAAAKLMDEADPETLAEIVGVLNQKRLPNWIDIHNLRVQQYGADRHIDCHLTLPYYLTLRQVHDESEAVQNLIASETPGKLEIFIHTDPCLPPDNCHSCQVADCPVRKADFSGNAVWTITKVVTDAKHFMQENE
ncbi:MAG: cation transporter [Verrucomicrobia bacterium]|nr:cation transporter [Cytophagales bacterium]